MKTLEDFRLVNSKPYAPSPVAAGLTLIGMGLTMIAEWLWKRSAIKLTKGQVWLWFDQRNYTRKTAIKAWGITLLWMAAIMALGKLITVLFLLPYATLPV